MLLDPIVAVFSYSLSFGGISLQASSYKVSLGISSWYAFLLYYFISWETFLNDASKLLSLKLLLSTYTSNFGSIRGLLPYGEMSLLTFLELSWAYLTIAESLITCIKYRFSSSRATLCYLMRFRESFAKSSSSYLSLLSLLNQSSSIYLATICSSFYMMVFFCSQNSLIMPSYTSNCSSKCTSLSSRRYNKLFLLFIVLSFPEMSSSRS